jgi:hypothetical protein
MPTKEEMALAYLEQIRQKVADANKQAEMLRRHLEECEEEFNNEKESSE